MSAVDVHGLPALPEGVWVSEVPVDAPLYTADQMRAYARAAVESALHQSGEAVHCAGHSQFEYDCIDCSDAIKHHTTPPATSGLVEALREVTSEMRARKINHGRNNSPTLIAWADRIDAALAAHDARGGK